MVSHHCSKTTILILAAGIIPGGPSGIAASDPGFLNIGTRLAVERIIEFYGISDDIEYLICVKNASCKLYELLPYRDLRIVEVGDTPSPSATILSASDYIQTDLCLINPITAIPTTCLPSESAIYFGVDLLPKENWSALTFQSGKKPVFHKRDNDTKYGLESFPFTGRIFAKTSDIVSALNSLPLSEHNDLINLGAQLYYGSGASIKHEKWLDIGHEATYAESKLISISSRYFNSLTYSPSRNTIIKRSSNQAKLRCEGSTYLDSPPVIRRYYPIVLSSSSNGSHWELELEYIAYPSLAEVFLFRRIGLNCWKRIIASLKRVYNDFYSGTPQLCEDAPWLYADKLRARHSELIEVLAEASNHPLNSVFNDSFMLNGRSFPALTVAYKEILYLLEPIQKMRPLFVGHGDLCFNNILVDPLSGALKLIDPRATTHPNQSVHGLMDPWYDLAKLNHSFTGLYDSIVNNLFNIRVNARNDFTCAVYSPPLARFVVPMFRELVVEFQDERTSLIITTSLFFSMLPLHKDDPLRMLGLFFVGSCLFLDGNTNLLRHDK